LHLSTTVLQINNFSTDFKVSLDRANDWIIIDFEYLNQHQGAVIEVIHTGLSSEDLQVVGDMKEVKSLIRLPPRTMRIVTALSLMRATAVIALGLLTMISALTMLTIVSDESAPGWATILVGVIIGILLGSATGYLAGRFRPTSNIPAGLEKFDE